MILNELYIAAQIALVAWTVRNILMAPGMILRPYFNWLDSLVSRYKDWIAKPLGYCDKCLAGQLAFWGFILLHLADYSPVLMFRHATFVCLTVFIVYQMQRIEIHDDDN